MQPPGRGAAGGRQNKASTAGWGRPAPGPRLEATSIPEPVEVGLGGWRPSPCLCGCSTGPSWRFQVHGKTEAERGQQRQEARLNGLHAPSRAWTWSLQPTPWPALRGTHGSNCKPGNQRGLRTGARGAQKRSSPSLEVREGFLEEVTILRRKLTGGKLLRVPFPGPSPCTSTPNQALPQPLPGAAPQGSGSMLGPAPQHPCPFPEGQAPTTGAWLEHPLSRA